MGYQDCGGTQDHWKKYRQDKGDEADRQHEAKRQATASRHMKTLRERMRAACEKCVADGVPISRVSLKAAGYSGHSGTISGLIDELIDDGTIEERHLSRKRVRHGVATPHEPKVDMDEVRVELPPLRSHAPEVPHYLGPKPEKTNAELYWTPARRAWYRRQA